MTWTFTDHEQNIASRMLPGGGIESCLAAILPDATAIAAFIPPPPTANDVRAEAYRRLRIIHQAVDDTHMANIVADDARERLVLEALEKPVTEATARLAEIKAKDGVVEAVWQGYNVMPDPPPVDFTSDRYWS